MQRARAPRLQRRIVAGSLLLLLAVQAASLLAVSRSVDANARAAVAAELATGASIFRRLIDQHSQRLGEAARLLAADYGFRAAVAGGDAATVVHALRDHGGRIGASLAVFASRRNGVVGGDASDLGRQVAQLAGGLGEDTPARQELMVIRAQPYVVVMAPVMAPMPVGWVVMGFALNRALLQDMQQMSALKVALVTRDSEAAPWQLQLSAFAPAQEVQLGQALRAAGGPGVPEIRFGDSSWGLRVVPLAGGPGQVGAVLLRSLDEALAPYARLQITLLGLTVLGLAVFAAGSVFTARRIVRPVVALSRLALRLGQGDYSEPIAVTADDELGDLARAFETMRQNIRQREAETGRLAYWDALTGLPNRQWFCERVARAAAQGRGADGAFAVMVLNVDRFRAVNDALGHELGDHLLQEAAQRLKARAHRCGAQVARLGGDEFAVLLPGADAGQARLTADEMLQAFVDPLQLGEHTVDLGASLGVAAGPEHGTDADTLLRRADIAMYAAKRSQAGVAVYTPGMDASGARSLSLLSDLRRAVARGELQLYLQPKVALASGRVAGAEVLLRWQRPGRGLVAPLDFIPFAEQTGFIRTLTQWVLEQSAQVLAGLDDPVLGGPPLRLSVNLSTRDLADPELPARVQRLLAEGGLAPHGLCLEITESATMEDPQHALRTLQRLHDKGLRLSIDDFGTGYSSLAYLKRLPVHELKIDRSFVMNMERDLDDAKIVRSTIDLAHNLGLHVVAEGVETLKAMKLLGQLHCDEAQGHQIARPMPAAQFAAWARAWELPSLEGERLDTDFANIL